MDPRENFPRPPPDPGETWSTPSPSPYQWIFEQQYRLAQSVAVLLANQATNKTDIIQQLREHRDHHDQRLDDLKGEIFPRFERLEAKTEQLQEKIASPSKPAPESSLAKSLFGSIGVGLFQILPWKHIGLMLPGILLAIASNMAPESMRRFILGIVDLFWKTPPA
jgi:hypothetical protein